MAIDKLNVPDGFELTQKINEVIDEVNQGGGGASLEKATQAEAELGVDNEKYMTPFATLKSIKANAGEGGGGGTAGRIKLVGTEADPIVLDNFTEPESYVISGVIEGLPEATQNILSNMTDWEVALDVSINMEESDEEMTMNWVTQELHFFDEFSLAPNRFQRLGAVMSSSEGTDVFFMDWREINMYALADCRLRRARMVIDNILLVDPNLPDSLSYVVSVDDNSYPSNAMVDDVFFTRETLDDDIFPQIRLSQLNDLFRLNNWGEVFLCSDKVSGRFILATIQFNSEQSRDDFFTQYQFWWVYVAYKTSYVVEE